MVGSSVSISFLMQSVIIFSGSTSSSIDLNSSSVGIRSCNVRSNAFLSQSVCKGNHLIVTSPSRQLHKEVSFWPVVTCGTIFTNWPEIKNKQEIIDVPLKVHLCLVLMVVYEIIFFMNFKRIGHIHNIPFISAHFFRMRLVFRGDSKIACDRLFIFSRKGLMLSKAACNTRFMISSTRLTCSLKENWYVSRKLILYFGARFFAEGFVASFRQP